MILHKESHTDRVPQEVLNWILCNFQDRVAFFAETVELPVWLPRVECGLHGPLMGDGPVLEAEVVYEARGGRPWSSRLVDRLSRPTWHLTIIGGPHEEYDCVLYTAFGGPLTPKEPQDPTLDPSKQKESQEFWGQHALSMSQ